MDQTNVDSRNDSSKEHKTDTRQSEQSPLEITLGQDLRFNGARCSHCHDEFPDRYRPVCVFSSDQIQGNVQRLYHPECAPPSEPAESRQSLLQRMSRLDQICREFEHAPIHSGILSLLTATLVPFAYESHLIRQLDKYGREINPPQNLRNTRTDSGPFNRSEALTFGTFLFDFYALFIGAAAATDNLLFAAALPLAYTLKSTFIYHGVNSAKEAVLDERKKIQTQIDPEGKTTYVKTFDGTLHDAGECFTPFGHNPGSNIWYEIDAVETNGMSTRKRLSFKDAGWITKSSAKAGDKVAVYENSTSIRVEVKSKWLGKLVYSNTHKKEQK